MKRVIVLLLLSLSMVAQTVNTNILPATTGLDLGSPGQQWDGYLRNLTVYGTTSFTEALSGAFDGTVGATTPNTGAFTTVTANSVTSSGGAINGTVGATTPSTGTFTTTLVKTLNSIRFADQFAGADACAKIAAALADLPSTGGVVDARGITGNQTCAANPFATYTGSGSLWLGNTTITTAATWVIPNKFTVLGNGRGDAGSAGTVIKAGSGFGANPVIKIGSTTIVFGTRLQNLTVDCNSEANTTGIFSEAMEEQSGIFNVLVSKVSYRGLDLDATNTLGGSRMENYRVSDVEVSFAPGVDDSAAVGIRLVGGSSAPYEIANVTINGVDASVAPTNLMTMDGVVRGEYRKIHFEHGTNGINIASSAACNGFVLDGISGHSSITDLIHITASAGVTQGFTIRNAGSNGGTNVLVDGDRSLTLTQSILPQYTVGTGTNKAVFYQTTANSGGLVVTGAPLFTDSVYIGANSSSITWFKKATHTALDLASVASGACTAAQTETITGSALGDRCWVTPANSTGDATFFICNVTATDTAKWSYCNMSGAPVDRTSTDYYISVMR